MHLGVRDRQGDSSEGRVGFPHLLVGEDFFPYAQFTHVHWTFSMCPAPCRAPWGGQTLPLKTSGRLGGEGTCASQ